LTEVDAEGNRLSDDDLFILLNGHHEPVGFVLPEDGKCSQWETMVDTVTGLVDLDGDPGRVCTAGEPFNLPARSLLLLRRRTG
jgi:glycogen operon protein